VNTALMKYVWSPQHNDYIIRSIKFIFQSQPVPVAAKCCLKYFLAVTAATKNRMQIKAGAYESCNCVIKTSCVANIRSETSRNVEA